MSWGVRTMRSGTSFFNSTLYRKTMLRFWPLWVAYGLMWLFLLPFNLLNNYFSMRGASVSSVELTNRLVEYARDIPNTLQFGVFVACGYGVLCAMAVFGYLYNNRSACMMHALPLRRETLFGTQYLAGLSFALLPNLVVAGTPWPWSCPWWLRNAGEPPWPAWASGCWYRAEYACSSSPLHRFAPCLPDISWHCLPSTGF